MSEYNPFNAEILPIGNDSELDAFAPTNPFLLEQDPIDHTDQKLDEYCSSVFSSRAQSVASQQEENATRADSVSSNGSGYVPFNMPFTFDPTRSIAEQMFTPVPGLGTSGYVQYGSSRSSSVSSQGDQDDNASAASSDLNSSIASEVSTKSVVKLGDGVQYFAILQPIPVIHTRLDMHLTDAESTEFKNAINTIMSYVKPVISGRTEDGSSKGPFKLAPEALHEIFKKILTVTAKEPMLELLKEAQALVTKLENQPKGQTVKRAIKRINPNFVAPTSAPDTPPRLQPPLRFSYHN